METTPSQSKATTPTTDLATRVRWGILILLSLSITINLLDRQVLSLVAPVLREQLKLTNTGYSYIVFSFQLGMFLGQVPAGILMDWVGTRTGMALILVAWSTFNGLHAVARNVVTFFGLRLGMGFTECGNYTGGIKAIAQLFPERRAFAGGIFNAGAQLGSVIAPPVIVLLTTRFGWHVAFLLPSIAGLIWVLPWLRWCPDETGVRQSTRNFRSGLALAPLIRNRRVLGLLLLRALTGPLYSFYWYWLPLYLRQGRGMSFFHIGATAWIPYLFGSLGNLSGGFVSDWLIRRGISMDCARKLCFIVGAILSSLNLIIPFAVSNGVALAIICLAIFGTNWTGAIYIGSVADMFPPNIVGRVNGIAGTGDAAAGMLTMLLTGVVVDHFSYMPVLIAAGVLPLAALASVFGLIRRIGPLPIEGLKAQG